MPSLPRTHRRERKAVKRHGGTVPGYREWYQTRHWRALRAEQLSRQPWCEHCQTRKGVIKAANTCDHIEPHRGNWTRFVDANNHQSLCASCHSIKTCTEDGGFGHATK